MVFGVYSIFDRKSRLYSNPELQVNDGTAVRYFNYVVSQSEMVKDDLELYCLGYFDQKTGQITANETPVYIDCFERSIVDEEKSTQQ